MEKTDLIRYVMHLGDNSLIAGHRNSQWCGHGPVLEQDIAITNIALDHIGQARNFFQYAAELKSDGSTEDSLAFLRTEREYLNCLLVEQSNGDWAKTTLRQFFLSAFQYLQFSVLRESSDLNLAAIAGKSLKEVTYHLKWSSEWVIRLGDGTAESRRRMEKAIGELWPYTGELFTPAPYEKSVADEKLAPDPASLKTDWDKRVKYVFDEAAGLPVPPAGYAYTGGKTGLHTEQLGSILAELQYMQRAYPGSQW